jgi:hypothetical protein
MHNLLRIVTYAPVFGENRPFFLCPVVYDDALTPIFIAPRGAYITYDSVEDLRKENPEHADTIVLDIDKNLSVYNPIN